MRMRTLQAGVVYFALVFAAGFVFGCFRVLLIVPRGSKGRSALSEQSSSAACAVLILRYCLFQLFATSPSSVCRFLEDVDAQGGTELAEGVRAAATLLGKTNGDLIVLTDGEVFGTEDILAVARQTAVRLHALGIGSASQDRCLALLARERVDLAAVDRFASVSRPVASQVAVSSVPVDGVTVSPQPARVRISGRLPAFDQVPGWTCSEVTPDAFSSIRTPAVDNVLRRSVTMLGSLASRLRLYRSPLMDRPGQSRVA